jgi:hypothetical protein
MQRVEDGSSLTPIRYQLSIASDVDPMVFVARITREYPPDLVRDHVEGFALAVGHAVPVITTSHNELDPLSDLGVPFKVPVSPAALSKDLRHCDGFG